MSYSITKRENSVVVTEGKQEACPATKPGLGDEQPASPIQIAGGCRQFDIASVELEISRWERQSRVGEAMPVAQKKPGALRRSAAPRRCNGGGSKKSKNRRTEEPKNQT